MDLRSIIEKISSVASWVGVLATIIAVVSYYGVFQKEMSEKLIYEAMSKRDISKKFESVLISVPLLSAPVGLTSPQENS